MNKPLERLRHHVTGSIERGEKAPVKSLTRLDILCSVHKQQGGTIHAFSRKYGVDILSLSDFQFNNLLEAIKAMQEPPQEPPKVRG